MELKGLKIMITGGAGFIGSHLVDRLVEKNSVIVYDNFDNYYSGKEVNIGHHIRKPNFSLIRADILDYQALCHAMRKVNVVFHSAAQPGVRYSLENTMKTNNVNVAGTLNVLRAAKKMGVNKFVFASSSSVYGILQYQPADENHPTCPISVYGISKLAAEKYCAMYSEVLGLPTVILRYHTVYGPRQRPDMAINKWTKQLFEGKPLVVYGDGRQTRDFTYISDIIDGTIKASEANDVDGEIFNLGGETRRSVNDVTRLLAKIIGKEDIRIIHESSKLGDVPDTQADITKAKRVLGYNPKVTLEEGLEKYVRWYKENKLLEANC